MPRKKNKPKRRVEREEEDGGEEARDGEASTEAASSGSGKSNKRRRLGEGDSDGDGAAEHRGDDSAAALEASSPSSSSRLRNGERRRNDIPTPLKSVNPAGKPAEAGVIKRVYVENFMCHRKLTVDLCRNVNFVHGQNGSGKSAILAAIQICLGAGARRTHRARNLKELVRKEAGSNCAGAKVRVTLLNRGDDAFQHDSYGDAITVERCISLRGGYNGYKLLDAQMREVSRSKKDLDAMLDQLNIQVENPVAVLDQEEAKKFLTGKPEDKYNFFTKATELERIDRSYASVVDNVDELQATNDRVRAKMSGAMENVKTLKREWEQFQELEKLEDKVLEHKLQLGWSVHNEFDRKVKVQEKISRDLETKREKRRQELAKAEEAANVTHDEESDLREALADLAEEATAAAETKSGLESKLKKAKGPVKSAEQNLASIKRESSTAEKRLKKAKKYLQDARDQILQAAGSAETEEKIRTAKIKKAEDDLADARSKLDPQREAIAEALRKYEELDPHVEQAKMDCKSVDAQLNAVKKKMKELQSSKGNSLAVFGKKCVAMHKAVEQARKARKFKGPVLGPIGSHIKIAQGKERFAKIAEAALGLGTLDRFIVTNDRDRQLYMKLRVEVGCDSRDCGVFQIHEGERYRVPPPPVEGVETVASALNISDDLVFNCLVDNARADQRALADSKEESERALLVKDSHGKDAIRGGKINEVFFLPDGDHWQVKKGARSMISNERKLKQTIGIDRTAAIEETKKEMDLLASESKELQKKESELAKEHREYKVKWNKENRAHRNTNQQIEKIQNDLEELNAEADAAADNTTIDTTELEEDVKVAEESIERLREKEAEVKQTKEDALPGIQAIQDELDEVTSRNEKVLEDIGKAEAKLEEYVKGKATREANVKKKRTKLQQLEEGLQKQEQIVEDLTEKRQEALLKARILTHRRRQDQKKKEEEERGSDAQNEENGENISPANVPPTDEDLESIEPIPTDRDPTFYKAKIERELKRIAKEKEKRNMSETDPEVALEKYQRAKRDLDSKMFTIETIEKNISILIGDMKERRHRWRQFRKHIGDLTNNTFDEMLNKKGSSGQIEFDHEAKSLNLVVQKDNTDEMSQTKDVKALSGGERSFTTLSLLLALGENLETPFRVMDEFDVFLDPVSRKIAMDTMVSVAKDMEHRQFIFITPQDLSSLKTDPMLKIFHLKAPARNSLVGVPTQQTLDFQSPS